MMAHFRRRSSNASAMTHFIPPRTTVNGIVANLLGIPRDEYYETFSCENVDVAIASLVRPRKEVYTLNYLNVKFPDDVTGVKQHTQVQTEFLFPTAPYGHLVYRIWFRPKKGPLVEDRTLKSRLDHIFSCGEYISYGGPVSLGLAHCLGWTENSCIGEVVRESDSFESTQICSVINLDDLQDLYAREDNFIIREDMVLDMLAGRKLKENSVISAVFDLGGKNIECVARRWCEVSFGGTNEVVAWLSPSQEKDSF